MTVNAVQAIALCRALVCTPSLSGNEGQVARVLSQAMAAFGFDKVQTDKYGNVIGTIQGTRKGPCILLDAHMDTVPVTPENWTRDPFAGMIENDRLYGRGATDMKGALAAMVTAAAAFAGARGRSFAGTVCVAGTVHEECFEGVTAREVSAGLHPDVVIIGEATNLNLAIGQRGRAEIVVETIGVPAHSASPEAGVNAISMMTRLIAGLEQIPAPGHPVLGKGISVVTDIVSSPWPGASVVPERCRATFDRRLLVNEKPEDALRPFRQCIADLSARYTDFHAEAHLAESKAACYTGEEIAGERFFPAWLRDADDGLVQKTLCSLRSAGLASELSHYAFCTNGSHYAGEAGIATLGFGPSDERLAHTDDEYIHVDHILKAVSGYQAVLNILLPD